MSNRDETLVSGMAAEPCSSEHFVGNGPGVTPVSQTIGSVIRRWAESQPERPAFVGSNFAPLSFLELQSVLDAVRASLREAGFSREARIAIAIGNSANAALMTVAICSCATAVPIDPKLTVPEVERCLRILAPSAVVVLWGTPAAARSAAEGAGLPIIEAKVAQAGKLGLKLEVPRIGKAQPLDDPDRRRPLSSCTPRAPPARRIWCRSAIATCWRSTSDCRRGLT